jgi:hypothetical protein
MVIGLHLASQADYPERQSDREELQQSYLRFQREAYLGVHELSQVAVEHLGKLLEQIDNPTSQIMPSPASTASPSADSMHYQMSGNGLRIPDTLYKKGEICSASWRDL